MDVADKLPTRNVIYQGDLEALADKYDELRQKMAGEFIGRDHECVALVQKLTDIGYTGRWQPGPRVIDLTFLLPGTVIANFVFENGKARFPDKHGWHAALFDRFCHGTIMTNGRPCEFSIFDQYHGKPAGRRGLAKSTANWKPAASDDAAAFYVVVVP